MKVNQLLLNKHKVDVSKQDVKGKAVVDIDDLDENQEKVTSEQPRTRGLQRALQQQREQSPPKEQMSLDDLITAEINQNREFWFEKVNFILENLLKRDKGDNKFQIHMVSHYYTRNQVSKFKTKKLKEKLNETLIKKKEKVRLDFLVYASLIA